MGWVCPSGSAKSATSGGFEARRLALLGPQTNRQCYNVSNSIEQSRWRKSTRRPLTMSAKPVMQDTRLIQATIRTSK
jgi:hypothetical protein